MNISLEGVADFNLDAYRIDTYNCPESEIQWEIQRANGETEVYTVVNDTYRYGRDEDIPDRGLYFHGYCHPYLFCSLEIEIRPTDLTYNGAQITGIVNLPECFSTLNTTDPMTLNIQGVDTFCVTHIYMSA